MQGTKQEANTQRQLCVIICIMKFMAAKMRLANNWKTFINIIRVYFVHPEILGSCQNEGVKRT